MASEVHHAKAQQLLQQIDLSLADRMPDDGRNTLITRSFAGQTIHRMNLVYLKLLITRVERHGIKACNARVWRDAFEI